MILNERVLHDVLRNLYMLHYMHIYMTLHDITCLLHRSHVCYIFEYMHDYMSNNTTQNIILRDLLHVQRGALVRGVGRRADEAHWQTRRPALAWSAGVTALRQRRF